MRFVLGRLAYAMVVQHAKIRGKKKASFLGNPYIGHIMGTVSARAQPRLTHFHLFHATWRADFRFFSLLSAHLASTATLPDQL